MYRVRLEWPQDSTKRSRPTQCGSVGSCRITRWNSGVGQRREAHRGARMAVADLLHGVGGEHPDGVDGLGVQIGPVVGKMGAGQGLDVARRASGRMACSARRSATSGAARAAGRRGRVVGRCGRRTPAGPEDRPRRWCVGAGTCAPARRPGARSRTSRAARPRPGCPLRRPVGSPHRFGGTRRSRGSSGLTPICQAGHRQ